MNSNSTATEPPLQPSKDSTATTTTTIKTNTSHPTNGTKHCPSCTCSSSSLLSPIATPRKPKSNRQHQRYEASTRLVCGCIPFRVVPLTDTTSTDHYQLQLLLIRSSNYTHALQMAAQQTQTQSQSSQNTHSPARTNELQSQPLQSINRPTHCTCTNSTNTTAATTNNNTNSVPPGSAADEWLFCKGGWETYETAQECAARESYEEAGVRGEVVAELGSTDFISAKEKSRRLHMFLLHVTDILSSYPEQQRTRQWFNIQAAASVLHRAEMLHFYHATVSYFKQQQVLLEDGSVNVQRCRDLQWIAEKGSDS